MTDTIAHRGPDDSTVESFGHLVVGHRRLSILDPTPASNQPMRSADGRFVAVHNGEIYNFLELADELAGLGFTFRTQSDTEVLLAAYAAWGPDCVTRLNGIWAFLIWDTVDERLFLSRDRFGIKPMFLARRGSEMAFASEIKALLTLPWVDRAPDPSMVRDYLLRGTVDHTTHTFFRSIQRLPAAHNMLVSRAGERTWRYWQPPALAEDPSLKASPRDDRLVADIRDLLIESVSLQLRTDVSIGSCLSGGMDSSTIVSIASQLRRGGLDATNVRHHERDGHPQLAFFAEFSDPGIDERRYVDDVVDQTGVDLRTVSPGTDEFLSSLGRVVWQQDEPFGSSSILAQYHVMRIAHESGVKVLLDGQGADELLAGYPPNGSPRYAGALRSRDGLGLTRRWLGNAPAPWARMLWYALTDGASPPTWARPSRHIREWLGRGLSDAESIDSAVPELDGTILARTLWRDVASLHLPGLLRFEDRNSMAFGIEARVPFLDHRLVEACLLLPDRLKIADGRRKVALRRAAADLLPSSILDRTDKIAFATPQERWLHAALPKIAGLEDSAATESLGLLRAGSVGRALAEWDTKRLSTDVLWRILNLELWARIVVFNQRDVLEPA